MSRGEKETSQQGVGREPTESIETGDPRFPFEDESRALSGRRTLPEITFTAAALQLLNFFAHVRLDRCWKLIREISDREHNAETAELE